MFEEDVPSVLELEMEELDQWMQQGGWYQSNKKNNTWAGPFWNPLLADFKKFYLLIASVL